jgi:hypothetical protein
MGFSLAQNKIVLTNFSWKHQMMIKPAGLLRSLDMDNTSTIFVMNLLHFDHRSLGIVFTGIWLLTFASLSSSSFYAVLSSISSTKRHNSRLGSIPI